MKRGAFLLPVMAILLIEVQTCMSNTLNVGSGYTYSTIQSAIDAAGNGDIVLVADGTYGGAYISGSIHGNKAITVRSMNGPQNCTIAGDFWFYNTNNTAHHLEGFTVLGCSDDYGAIYCSERSSPTISNCIVTENRGAAGIRCNSLSNPNIVNCVIKQNSTYGLMIQDNSTPTITNCIIAGNLGAGIYSNDSQPSIINSTIASNTGNGILFNNQRILPVLTVTNSILWQNSGSAISLSSGSSALIDFSDVQGGWSGLGNINVDPLFVGSGNFSLRQDSLCIDAGKNVGVYSDILGNARPYDFPGVDHNGSLLEFDMGAYEVIPEPMTLLLLGLGAVVSRRRK